MKFINYLTNYLHASFICMNTVSLIMTHFVLVFSVELNLNKRVN